MNSRRIFDALILFFTFTILNFGASSFAFAQSVLTRPAADAVGISTAGSERVRVSPTGNVGIGTTNPAAKLDINGTVYSTGGMGSREVAYTVAAGATYPGSGGIDMTLGNVFNISPSSAGACPTVRLDLTTMTAGLAYTVALAGYNSGTCNIQDQTGATTNIRFFGGSAPTLSSAQDVVCSAIRSGSKLYLSCLNF